MMISQFFLAYKIIKEAKHFYDKRKAKRIERQLDDMQGIKDQVTAITLGYTDH